MSDTCGNDEVARMDVQSFEVDPQNLQVVREKQIKEETATAPHVFSGEDATVANSSPLDSNEKLIQVNYDLRSYEINSPVSFELNEFPQEALSAMSEGQIKNELPHHDYSDLPDLSDSILNDDDRIKFRELFRRYRDVFALADKQLGKTALVQHMIDTGNAMPIKQRP